MKTSMNEMTEGQDIEELLPWYAAGTLDRRDSQRVEQALQRDPRLALQLALVRDELAQTIHLNETLGAPSAAALDKLMTRIEAESGSAPAKMRLPFRAWLGERIAGLSSRTLAYAAAIGAIVIIAQAGVLTSLYVGGSERPAGAQLASAPSAQKGPGTYLLMTFAPAASSADVTRLLAQERAVIVDGPRGDGIYRIRISAKALPRDDVMQTVARIRKSAVVGFVAPAE